MLKPPTNLTAPSLTTNDIHYQYSTKEYRYHLNCSRSIPTPNDQLNSHILQANKHLVT